MEQKWNRVIVAVAFSLLLQIKVSMSTVSCSLFSCQLTVLEHLGLLIQSKVPNTVNPTTGPAEWSRIQCWRKRRVRRRRRRRRRGKKRKKQRRRRRTGQRVGAETVWSVRMQRWTEYCCPADTPVCVTAVCHTSSTAPSAGPSSWSLSPWHSDLRQNNDSKLDGQVNCQDLFNHHYTIQDCMMNFLFVIPQGAYTQNKNYSHIYKLFMVECCWWTYCGWDISLRWCHWWVPLL